MTSRTRSAGGCWTCRLRRKKCDEGRPVCVGCSSLEIECIYSDEKPEWMDGGEKQKEQGERLKQEVKRLASYRRERRYMQGLDAGLESLNVSSSTGADDNIIITVPQTHPLQSTQPAPPSSLSGTTGTPGSSCYESYSHKTDTSLSLGSTPSSTEVHMSDAASSPEESHENVEGIPEDERDAHRTMFYLDYVFPFLFPFYRPSIQDYGRGWLLVLLQRNKALFYTAQTLAAYFYGRLLNNTSDGQPELCKSHNMESMQKQQELSLQWLRREIQDIMLKGVKDHLSQANGVMACIVQLVMSEVAVANSGNWMMHLDAATELYNEMWKHHGIAEGSDHVCFMLLLLQLGTQRLKWTPKNHPWASDQATFRFFTAQLLYFDTIASTTLEQKPRLQQWHQHLLTEPDEEMAKWISNAQKETVIPHINLLEFIGVENWMVMALGEIAALDAWKKEMKKSGSLSMMQLVTRASAIENTICDGIKGLQLHAEPEGKKACPRSSTGAPPHPLLRSSAQGMLAPQTMHTTAFNTRVWAQAALTYLRVVVSGWQPASQEIRESVTETLNMMLLLPAPDCMRTLVWPFTVTGSLAAPEQEQIFRDLASSMGPLRAFGPIKEGLGILEYVWAHRSEIEEHADQWDLAACFKCLGRPALLI
ncbi:fungal-specific transcription factor domain-containing protein [Podospora australis]|uniref:Fungal-specific transcription factor domain-containing protein n=1 Tax=Podospora australis TaxID=1536484 RepID=A0AAN6X397_9PEZI|nr:fungal-specific transcription factor domain-containing protein [Podospora australis]